jgi:thiamine pyrophosphate-dependent acetolactate synthase large subunit-like protein
MTVYELIADAVAEEGTEVVFAVMGDGNMKWLLSLEQRHAVRVVYCRHESTAVGMADAYARVTGKPGVCTVTCGPGMSLIATSLIIASRNRSPLIVIAGDIPRGDYYYQQRFDQQGFVELSEATSVDLRDPSTAAEDLLTSFTQARLGQPVVLNAAFDVQEQPLPDGGAAYRSSAELVVPVQAIRPDPGVVAEAAAILEAAERPAILGGRGAFAARGEIEALADQTGAVLVTTLKAKGLFEGHPRHLGVAGGLTSGRTRAMLREADCVLAIGASLNQYTTDAGALAPGARFIQVSLERQELMDGRRMPVNLPGGKRRADCYVQGDALCTVEALRELLPPASEPGWDELLDAYDAPDMSQPEVEVEPGTIHPRDAMRTLSEAADPRTRFVVGLGHFWWFPIVFLEGRDASSYLFVPEMGAIGQTFAAALGAAVGDAPRPVVLIEGDASLMMSIQELDTAVRHGIDLVVVIMNDSGLGAEFHKLEADGTDASAARIQAPEFARVAEALGARGARVESLEQLADAVREAQAAGGPAVIDARISDAVINDWFWNTYYAERALPAAS